MMLVPMVGELETNLVLIKEMVETGSLTNLDDRSLNMASMVASFLPEPLETAIRDAHRAVQVYNDAKYSDEQFRRRLISRAEEPLAAALDLLSRYVDEQGWWTGRNLRVRRAATDTQRYPICAAGRAGQTGCDQEIWIALARQSKRESRSRAC